MYERKSEREQVEEQANIDANGVVTWKSNGNVPFDDMLEGAIAQGAKGINLEACRKERKRQNDEFFARYREAQKNRQPSAEEMFEMRAAFGPGAEVVDVITGRKIKL